MHEIDDLLSCGVDVLQWARNPDSLCRERIADKLLGLYNDTWAPEHGPGPMSRATFCERIMP